METNSIDYKKVIHGLTIFGSRKKPLFLIIRGGECLQPELSQLFTSLVDAIKNKPLCIIVVRKNLPDFMNQLGVFTEE